MKYSRYMAYAVVLKNVMILLCCVNLTNCSSCVV